MEGKGGGMNSLETSLISPSEFQAEPVRRKHTAHSWLGGRETVIFQLLFGAVMGTLQTTDLKIN